MATMIRDSGLHVMEGEAAALTPTTTPAYQQFQPDRAEARIYGSAAFQMVICPKLVHAVYYDATDGSYTDYIKNVVDKDLATHLPLDAMVTGDYLYLGVSQPVRGFYFWMDNTNKNAENATLDMEYCSTALSESASLAWTDVASDSDGTNSGSATLAQSGAYTFTLPAVRRSHLGTWQTRLFTKCYWYRFAPSAALSATIEVEELMPIYKNTNWAYMQATTEYVIPLNYAEASGFIFYAASGNPNVYVSWQK